jgi:hypothetical protein
VTLPTHCTAVSAQQSAAAPTLLWLSEPLDRLPPLSPKLRIVRYMRHIFGMYLAPLKQAGGSPSGRLVGDVVGGMKKGRETNRPLRCGWSSRVEAVKEGTGSKIGSQSQNLHNHTLGVARRVANNNSNSNSQNTLASLTSLTLTPPPPCSPVCSYKQCPPP